MTELAKKLKNDTDLKKTKEVFRCYVRSCKNIQQAEQKLHKYTERGEKRKQAKHAVLLAKLKTHLIPLKYREGPVCQYVADLKVSHNIIEEGQHGGSYNGNHCNKFMGPDVYSDICRGILVKTQELTDCPVLRKKAEEIKDKFTTLNQRFSSVHDLISSAQPVKGPTINSIQWAITSYMLYFRNTFPKESIVPKQHMLEQHCVEWIRMWGFGMGFHGEQGGERIHSVCNKLMKDRFSGVKNRSLQLEFLMKAQNLKSCPDTIPSPKPAKRQRKQ